MFLKPWPLQDELEIEQKSIKNRSTNLSKKLLIFWSILDRFLVDFGVQVGAKLDQKSIKKGMQHDMQKSILKNPRKSKNGHATSRELVGGVP